MTFRSLARDLAVPVILLSLAACSRDSGSLGVEPPNTDPVVFDDDFGDSLDYQAFLNSKADAVMIDNTTAAMGTASLQITVPAAGHPTDWFAGGAFTVTAARDLTPYNALTFYAKASRPDAPLDAVGYGNDNTGGSLFQAEVGGLELTTDWVKYVLPIPNSSVFTSERGLFWYAEGAEQSDGASHTVWFDEVKFENLSGIANVRPELQEANVTAFVGSNVEVTTSTTFAVDGEDITVNHLPGHFDFFSSNESVATVSADGTITVVGGGTTIISAKLGEIDATGQVTVEVDSTPADPAPTPTRPAGNVVSLFSNAYTDFPVDTWRTDWSPGAVTYGELQIQGDDVKVYQNLSFVGIEFAMPGTQLNLSTQTHLHLDVWLGEPGTSLGVKLVDFGPNGVFGSDDSEGTVTFNSGTTPVMTPGQWIGLDIPLADFGLNEYAHVSQLVFDQANGSNLFIDNLYFYSE